MSYPASHNLLIISDLHLGEDLKPASKSGYLRHVPMLERELESFLEHYRKFRRDGRPWELIVNGDMVDFLSVCLFPEKGEPSSELDPEDHVWGLGTGPVAANAKMLRVLERHPGVFRALARFIGAGNRLGIVVGNHDVEFHWPGVQETFRQGVAKLWSELPRARRAGAPSAEEIAAAISFHPWFYYREDLVWVEHGHQYDTYCSFDHFLEPVEPDRDKVMMSLGGAAYRYVSNHVAGADPHQQEDWNALGYVRFSIGLGLRGLWRMARGYLGFVLRCLSVWRLLASPKLQAAIAARGEGHRRRMRELAEKFRIKEDILVTLDNLRQRPVFTQLTRLVMAVMLDRLALAVLTSLLAVVAILALPSPWSLAVVGGLFGVAYTVAQALSRARGDTSPEEHMKAVPQKIREHVRAPFVVFGHSHHPVALPLSGGGWYFNTGTWVATEKPGLLRSFTHLVIRDGVGGPRAALCQWRDGRSLAFAPEARAG
jgi:UDP-2,3-diacylglucosamine pyrophosphatase LpxH